MINNSAKNKIRDLIVPEITNARIGTGTTEATSTDTDLDTEITSSDQTPTVTISNKTISTSTFWNAAEANGETVTESSVDFTDGVMLDRFVFPDYDKTASNTLTVIDIINIL